ncbi:hypothetical protein EYC56_00175 [Xanthomonas oryzae]|nr:hypothetical protein EYC56_00175 [Xanthomonas oryzae]
MVRPLFFHCLAPRGAACFGAELPAAGSLRAAEGRGNRAPAQALRIADVRSSMACNSPVSRACHVVHALVAGCRLDDALVRRSRATMHERRASDLIGYRATASAHATCALSATVVGAARGQRCQSGRPS